jgi:hypothetical protein
MEKIKLSIESYLFNGENGTFRAIPFYELSMTEWVIYEDGDAKYYIDANGRHDPIVKMLLNSLDNGASIEQALSDLGKSINRNWTTESGLHGKIDDSWQLEEVTLYHLRDLKDLSVSR